MIPAVLAGALFAFGLAISGMADPAKVTAFLDVTGHWDPTLAFVMFGAIAVHLPFVRLAKQRARPLFGDVFHWPDLKQIDGKLVVGSAVFGVGWGLSGYCPGPALASLVGGASSALVFVAAMVTGIAVTRRFVPAGADDR